MPSHVLLVEDSVLVTDALRILLDAMGHRVTVAHNVAGAIAACDAEVPDVMLLDLTLPDGSGLDALAEIRRRGRVPAVVTAMTGHDDDATRRRCLEAGCGQVLVKPVASRELLRLLDVWGAARGARAAGAPAPPGPA